MTAMLLPFWFFITAALYATVGFGGGSTYTALIAMTDMPVWRIPIIALACNIVVVALGSYLAITRRAFDWRDAAPFFIASVPMAFIGGLIPLRDDVYISLLAGSLMLAGARLLFVKDTDTTPNASHENRTKALFIGGGLGLLSGMVGIGGGIFLAPILHYLQWAEARTIAALCSVFILVNSIAGLVGQLIKNGLHILPDILTFTAPLLVAVTLGGLLGSRVLLERVSQHRLRQITALLIIFVALRLLWRL